MSTTRNILLVCSDPGLRGEMETAIASLNGSRPAMYSADDHRRGLEMARSRSPELALVEMTTDMRSLERFARDVAAVSPQTAVAAVFRPDVFGEDVSESALLISAIRAGVRDFLRRPVSGAELEELLGRTSAPSQRRSGPLGRVLSFISNKGGVGKSTLAVNVACGLAVNHPGEVLLIDASLQLGVCASLLDLKPSATLTDAVRERDRLDETLLRQLTLPHECGLDLLAAPRDAAEVDDETITRILTLSRQAYRFVVIDTFPLLDRVVIAILDLSDRTYVVTENVVPTLLGTVQLLKLLESLGYPADRQRVLLNRFTSIAGHLTRQDVADRLGRPVDEVFPYDKRVVTSANTGVSVAFRKTFLFPFGRALKHLTKELEQITESEPTEK